MSDNPNCDVQTGAAETFTLCLEAPDLQTIACAARTLAARRKRLDDAKVASERTFTGFIFGRRRGWVGQPVELPDGSTAWVKRAQARFVCVRTSVVDPQDGAVHNYLPATALKPYRLPEAVLLGRLKRGKAERKSASKASAARRNGAVPVTPGRRPRGRPRVRIG